ncbi:hypothetical protein VPH35_001748 [Triticum aestivum]
MDSLQLDIKALQHDRDLDRKEFQEFQSVVNKNFADVQKSLLEMQSSLTHLITALTTKEQPPNTPPAGQGSVHQITPQAPLRNPAKLVHSPNALGSAVLHDVHTGKELNLDGTQKQPYRHPNFGAAKQQPVAQENRTEPVLQAPADNQLVDLEQDGEICDGGHRRTQKAQTLVKPAKMNIPEFEGENTDSWIQTMDLYFNAARTPPETKTEIAVSYLKGPAMECCYNALVSILQICGR